MKILLALLAIILVTGCEKKSAEETKLPFELMNRCFKGRYLTKSCSDGAIVQIMEPGSAFLKKSTYFRDGITHENVIMTDIPEEYKDGRDFYFEIEGGFNTFIAHTACSWPRYAAVAVNFGRNGCED